jgi:hypothetical protein
MSLLGPAGRTDCHDWEPKGCFDHVALFQRMLQISQHNVQVRRSEGHGLPRLDFKADRMHFHNVIVHGHHKNRNTSGTMSASATTSTETGTRAGGPSDEIFRSARRSGARRRSAVTVALRVPDLGEGDATRYVGEVAIRSDADTRANGRQIIGGQRLRDGEGRDAVAQRVGVVAEAGFAVKVVEITLQSDHQGAGLPIAADLSAGKRVGQLAGFLKAECGGRNPERGARRGPSDLPCAGCGETPEARGAFNAALSD